MQFPITIGLHRSSFLRLGVGLAHALALAAILIPAWPIVVKVVLAAVVLGSAGLAWKNTSPVVDALRLVDPGRLECRLAGSCGFVGATLRAPASVHPWLVVLPLEVGDRRVVLAVWPDTAPAEELRCLRVWLRWRTEVRHQA